MMSGNMRFALLIVLILIYSNKSYSIVKGKFYGNIIPCENGKSTPRMASCTELKNEAQKYPNIKIQQFACPLLIPKASPDLQKRQFLSVAIKGKDHLGCDYIMNKLCEGWKPGHRRCHRFYRYMRPYKKRLISDYITPDVPKSSFSGYHHEARKQIPNSYSNCLWHGPSVSEYVHSNDKICSKIKNTELSPFTPIFIENNKNLGGMLNQWSRDNYLEMIRAVGVNRILKRHFQLTGSSMEGINIEKCSQFQKGIQNILEKQKRTSLKNASLLDHKGNREHPTSLPYQFRIVAAAKQIQKLIALRKYYKGKIILERRNKDDLLKTKFPPNHAMSPSAAKKMGIEIGKISDKFQALKIHYQRKIKDAEEQITGKMATYSFLTFDRDGSYWGENNIWDKQPWISKVAAMKPGSDKMLNLMKSFVARTSSDLKDTLHRLCQVPGQEILGLSPIAQSFKDKKLGPIGIAKPSSKDLSLCIAAVTESKVNTEIVGFIKQGIKQYRSRKNKNTKIDPNLEQLLNSQCSPKDDAFSVGELVKMTGVTKEVLKAYPEYKRLGQCLEGVTEDSANFYSNFGMAVGLGCLGSAFIFPPFALACGAADIALMKHNHSLELAATQKVIACRQAGEVCNNKMLQGSLDRLHTATTDLLLSVGGEVAGGVLSLGTKTFRAMKNSRKIIENMANLESEFVHLSQARRGKIENKIREIKNSNMSKDHKLKMIKDLIDEVNDVRATQKQLISELGSRNNAASKFPCLFN